MTVSAHIKIQRKIKDENKKVNKKIGWEVQQLR